MLPKEKDIVRDGEIALHREDAVEQISSLIGTPVDDVNLYIKDTAPPVQADFRPIPEVKPPADGFGRILIVVPILSVSQEFFDSFLRLWQALTIQFTTGKLKYEIGYHFLWRKPVHIAETMGANIALSNKCTHVLFMDDDIYDVTPQMIDMLYDADKDVISGVMYASGFPYNMCTFRRFDDKETVSSQPALRGLYRLYEIPADCPNCKEVGKVTRYPSWNFDFCPICRKDIPKDWAIQPVDLIPFPLTLMKTSVFGRIKKPWFHCNTVFPTDSWFADRCIEAGIQEYAHMNVRLNHRGVTDITRPYRLQEGIALLKSRGGALLVTPEALNIQEQLMEEKMNEAEERMRYRIQPSFLKPDENKGDSNEQRD